MDSPRRRDVQGPATPAADTGLWKTRVIVRQHRVDYDATPVDAPEVLQLSDRMIDSFTRGHQRRAVLQGPPVANPLLFRSITQGDNRAGGVGYDASPGLVWNA